MLAALLGALASVPAAGAVASVPAAGAVASVRAAERMLSWLLTLPGAEIGPVRLGVSHCGAGRGLFLSEAVEDGELLFVVPVEAAVSLRDALLDPLVGEV